MSEGELVAKMRARAQQERPAVAERLTEWAERLENVLRDEPENVPKLVGTWAKARRLYCEATGEPLV